MIFKNLSRRKTRTVLTLLGIAVGVGAVVSLSAFGEGFATGLDRAFASSDADLVVAQGDAMMFLLSSVDAPVGDQIRQMPGVDEVTGVVLGTLEMPESPYFIVSGEEPRGFSIRHFRVALGQPLTAKKQILLGILASKTYGKSIGDTLRLRGSAFEVVGIFETGATYEDGGAVIGLADAQTLFGRRRQVSYFNIKVDKSERIDSLKTDIEARWPELAATRSGEPTRQTEALGLYRSFGWFLGIFAILIGGMGMMNTVLMSVFERTREIGVLRAVGWRRGRIVGMILGEALILAGAGGILGLGLGIGLTWLTRLSPAVQSLLEGTFTPQIFIQAFVMAVLLGTLGAVYPAWRASRLSPIEAMRQEAGASVRHVAPRSRLGQLLSRGPLRNVLRQPIRTLVSAAGIGIGVSLVVVLLAVQEGFRAAFTAMAQSGRADLMAQQSGSDPAFSAVDERLVGRVAAFPGVRSVSRIIFGVSTSPGIPYLLLMGMDPYEEYALHYRIREGRMLQRPHDIVLGRLAASAMGKVAGESLQLGGTRFHIAGIYENGIAWEDAGAAISIKDAQAFLNKPKQISLIGISLIDPSRAAVIAGQLQSTHPKLAFTLASKTVEGMADWITMNAILIALMALATIVGGIVMMNTMLMAVFERTQEIGVLRALGWRRRRVVMNILAESLAVSLLSAVLGSGLGVLLALLVAKTPGYGSYMQPAFTPQMFITAIVLAVALGALGGIYPAWRASGLRPIEALRYE